jgi:restriction system-associated AAA family ATPase
MRLHHLKILGSKERKRGFRGLPAGSEFRFDNTELTDGKLEPVCLVGLNGSGKSNLLEVICEIFYFLDNYVLSEGKPLRKFMTDFGFEISYSLDITFQLARDIKWDKLKKLSWEGTRNTKILIVKEPGQLPKITLTSDNNKEIVSSTDHDIFILPNHIIAYSSGQNELISNPFIKSNYHYFELLEKKLAKEINLELGLNRLFFLDYESSQIATICNYLFAEQNKVELITKELKLNEQNPIDSFSITLHYKNYRNNRIILPLSIQSAIENLRSCATVVEEVKEKVKGETEEVVELKLAFWFSPELRNAFQRKFGSAIALFRDLYYLNLLNIHLHGVDARKQIKDAPSMTYDNLSYMVPVPLRKKLIFVLDKIRLNKKDEEELIKYKHLSDGEHQLLHVLGSIMLLNTSGSILLYDEPETHFNPDWRSQLITLINKATEEKREVDKIRKQEIFITSHSPFIVSDCRRERVFIFEKGKATNPKINTFGTSVNIITEEVFKKKESISGQSVEKIEEIKRLPLGTLPEIEKAKEEARVLGESVEKILLFRELLIKENKIKEDDTKL